MKPLKAFIRLAWAQISKSGNALVTPKLKNVRVAVTTIIRNSILNARNAMREQTGMMIGC